VVPAVVLSALLLALPPFHSAIQPLTPSQRTDLSAFWHSGCPVPLSRLRVLTVSHWDFDGHRRLGQLVVNRTAAAPLAKVFRQLYRLRFPIRHMQFTDAYGSASEQPSDGDISGSFECRRAVPSPCGTGTGHWSQHAYGLAVDLNPIENPYTGCGRTRERASLPYLNRSKLRRGMVTPAVVRAFRSIGWGWGGSWAGSTKDYMHFSSTGH
jgi:D-alanyl-D-alanine carboxypeptidase